MASVKSRSEYPNREFMPVPDSDEAFEDPETELGRSLRPRHHSSYEEMNGYTPEGKLHQYEDPRMLVDQVRKINQQPSCGRRGRPRKKPNDLYEGCRTDSYGYGSDNSTHIKNPRCYGAMCLFVILSVVFALAALALSLLIVMGIFTPNFCTKCTKLEVHQDSLSTSMSSSTTHLIKMVKELQVNLTALRKGVEHREATIKDLIHNDKAQTRQLVQLALKSTYVRIFKNDRYNVSQTAGPGGPRGYNGSRGPAGAQGTPGKPGSGNFSTCTYKSKSTPFTPSQSSLLGQDVTVREPKGWIILSATCSTDGAAQSNLRRLENGLDVRYNCQCRGQPADQLYSTTATCFIHYWQCPRL